MDHEETYQRMNYSEDEAYATEGSLYAAAKRFIKKVDNTPETRAESSGSHNEFEMQCGRKAASLATTDMDSVEHSFSEDSNDNSKNGALACCLALLSGFCHALSMTVNTELGAVVGKDALFLQAFGAAFAFLSYHLVKVVQWLLSGR